MIDTGDTAWMLVATALVLMMTPALGLFYAGLVRSKNTLNTFMMCIAAIAVATVTWAVVGYSLAFDGTGDLVGGLDHAFLQRRRLHPAGRHHDPAPRLLRLPGHVLHHHHRPGVRRGGRADALRCVPGLRGAWSVLVYAVMAHWAFGGGWLMQQGTLDFAGGVPVEMGVRLLGAGSRAGRRRAQGLRAPGAAAPQRGVRPGRRRPALVRLVRIQRRQRLLDRRPQRARVREHPALPGVHAVGVVRTRRDPRAPGHRHRRRHRDHRRAAWASPRRAASSAPAWAMVLGALAALPELRRHRVAHAHAGGRDARRARRARHRGLHGDPVHRLLRPGVVERRVRRPLLRQRRSAPGPGGRGAGRAGLRVRRDLRVAAGDRRRDAAARDRARGGPGHGRGRPRRGGLRRAARAPSS